MVTSSDATCLCSICPATEPPSTKSASTILPRNYIYLFLNSESAAGVPLELYDPVGGCGNFDDVFKSPSQIYPAVVNIPS